MAIPRGRNGEEEAEEAFFEQEFEFEDTNSVPPHLLNLFDAAENGNLVALRHALGIVFCDCDLVLVLEGVLELCCSDSSKLSMGVWEVPIVVYFRRFRHRRDNIFGEFELHAERGSGDNLTGSIDQPLEDGDTALHLTCLYGHLSCVQLLLERGASLEAKDEDGALPLHDACAGGYTEIAQLLINSAPDPDCVKRMLESVDVEGDTPLHHAARGEHVNVIRLLLASGAYPSRTNIYGKTPSELAAPDTEPQRILEEAASAVPSQ
ncbi:hypothetical protein MTR67_045779 [Solanum verrucosum]|uniref:Uncharacterized protein n=1 Tax=Solanum verrucosum TaxID=315347 RepID=A0AAF0UVX0_SOLVR|nr:hypothetical protein MTR67_045779 [Solanum verrucosum]